MKAMSGLEQLQAIIDGHIEPPSIFKTMGMLSFTAVEGFITLK